MRGEKLEVVGFVVRTKGRVVLRLWLVLPEVLLFVLIVTNLDMMILLVSHSMVPFIGGTKSLAINLMLCAPLRALVPGPLLLGGVWLRLQLVLMPPPLLWRAAAPLRRQLLLLLQKSGRHFLPCLVMVLLPTRIG